MNPAAPSKLKPDLVDCHTIAWRLTVKPRTVYKWRERGILPTPDDYKGGSPLWYWNTIWVWARETGRA